MSQRGNTAHPGGAGTRDLRLSLAPAAAGYRVTIGPGMEGAAATTWAPVSETVPPLDLDRLHAEYLDPLRSFVDSRVPAESVAALGKELARRLFPPRVLHRVVEALSRNSTST